MHISSSWLSLQNGQTIRLLLFELGLLSLPAFPFSSDEPVAKALKQEFPLSRAVYLVLPRATLSLFSSVLSACKKVTGLNKILASFSKNLQNSLKGGSFPSLFETVHCLRLVHLRLSIHQRHDSISLPLSLGVSLSSFDFRPDR